MVRVESGEDPRPEFGAASEEGRRRWLVADAAAAMRIGLAPRPDETVTLVGTSLGTLAMGPLLAEHSTTPRFRAVSLTPLLRDDALRGQMRRFGGPALVAIGTADPHHDPAWLADVCAAPRCSAVVVEATVHPLDVAGDPLASVRAVGRVIAALGAFLARANAATPPGPVAPLRDTSP